MAFRLSKGSVNGKFFYQKDGVVYGPVTREEILGRIRPDTLVYYEGIQWTAASNLPELDFRTVAGVTKNSGRSARQEVNSSPSDKRPDELEIPEIKPEPVAAGEKSSGKKPIAVVLLLLFLCGGIVAYFLWYKPYLKDKNALRMYSYASSLVLRSSPVSGVDYNEIGNLTYGTEVLVYSINGEWATCKGNGTEGFASSKYLLSKQDFHVMNSIFADQVTRDAVPTSKCKKALLMYFQQKGFIGKMDESMQMAVFDSTLKREVWQLVARDKNLKPNSVYYARVVSPNSKFTDFACVITNVQTGARRFLLFTFNELEEPSLVAEQDAPPAGNISNVVRADLNGYGSYNVYYAD
jgi:hypothetical protein